MFTSHLANPTKQNFVLQGDGNLNNPWQEINFEVYENHMKSDAVFQLQTLNQITKEQLECYGHEIVGILGVAGEMV